MLRPYRLLFLAPLTVALVLAGSATRLAGSAAAELPASLTDQEFWRLSGELSEPDGTFSSDNLVYLSYAEPGSGGTISPGGRVNGAPICSSF